MRKLVAAVFLAAISTSVMAEWKQNSSDKDSATYVDASSARKYGVKIKIWSLISFKTYQKDANGHDYKSLMTYNEFNCADDEYRHTSYLSHSEEMGAGETVYSSTVKDAAWEPVPPGTIISDIAKYACKVK